MHEPKVIVLEDDKSLAGALAQLLEKEGIGHLVTSKPEEARNYLATHRVAAIFIDCLLPSENGVDFAKSLRAQFPKDTLDIILMSGVFTDPSFVRDSIREAEAIAFLKKPFKNQDLLQHIKRPTAASEAPHPRKVLYQLFNHPDASVREKRKAIEALEEIHGFDLPLIYSLLVDSKLSGHLNIVTRQGEVSGISFSEGLIVGVDIVDRDTYLGKLLIESGFLLADDLNLALNEKNTKKLGERLLQGNMVSPHGFNIVLANQMSIRLSRTIVDQTVRVNFVPTDVEASSPNVDAQLFQNFLHDWIASKITNDWLKAHFTPWGHARFVKAAGFESKSSALNMPLVKNLEGLIDKVTSGSTLTELLDGKVFPEQTLYKSLHFLLTSGLLAFEERALLKESERIKLMRTMLQQFSNKNKFEIFDLMARMTNSSESRPDTVYREFSQLLGDEPPETQKECVTLYRQLAMIGKGAYDFARSSNRDKMKEEMLKGEVEMKLKASSLFDEAKNGLQKSQFRESLALLQKIVTLDPKMDKLHLYLAWAKLGCLDHTKNKLQALKEIDMDLMQVAPEDKFDSLYNFVMGLYSKAKGDTPGARKAFEKAIAMDNSMIVARRELTVLSSQTTQKTDLLNADLKTLVGNIFSRKR